MSDGLVTVARFRDWSEAQIARGLLEANGIPCWLGDANIVGVNWSLSQAVGGIRLNVAASDEGDARLLLRDVDTGATARVLDAQPAGDDPIDECPACGSADVFRPTSMLGVLATAWFGVATPLGSRRRICRSCGKEWRAG